MVPTEISKDHAIHAFQVVQLLMEMHHALWLDSEHSLQAEQANSAKLKAALQVGGRRGCKMERNDCGEVRKCSHIIIFFQKSTTLLKERKETASMLSADMAKEEKETYLRQIADYKDYIEKVEEEKRLLEADLGHLANELEKFRERGTNYHGS
jgi:hypothetical protein